MALIELRQAGKSYGARKVLEDVNLSARMVRRWANIWGRKRLKQNLKLALRFKSHYPIHLILLEIAGGIMGARAYRRSLRNVRNIAYVKLLRQQREQGAAA